MFGVVNVLSPIDWTDKIDWKIKVSLIYYFIMSKNGKLTREQSHRVFTNNRNISQNLSFLSFYTFDICIVHVEPTNDNKGNGTECPLMGFTNVYLYIYIYINIYQYITSNPVWRLRSFCQINNSLYIFFTGFFFLLLRVFCCTFLYLLYVLSWYICPWWWKQKNK